MIRMSLRRLVL